MTLLMIPKGYYFVHKVLFGYPGGQYFYFNSNTVINAAILILLIAVIVWASYNEKLKSKSTEFNPSTPDLNETYLRITLGKNSGESPGIPYVLEIWPSNHYSPIHSHAATDAIIRVLYGEINVKLFPFLSKKTIEPFGTKVFKKDDITWISPELNKVHQLINLNNESSCITIQCYIYGKKNRIHYDYFDYISEDNQLEQYEPDSDMDFVDFKLLMKKEWTNKSK